MGLASDPTVENGSTKGDPRALAQGTTVGRYLLLAHLGEGGMGVVYKAFDPELDRQVALKLLHTGEGAASERLLREAQALARLSHPNVVAVHDVGTFGAHVFIAMEFVEGLTLRQWLSEKKPAPGEIIDVLLAAGEGLAAAHRAGLVHRDFKPDNVIVGSDGRVRVLDFGLARTAQAQGEVTAREPVRIDGDALAGDTAKMDATVAARARTGPVSDASASLKLLSSPLTVAGAIMGTPRFMAAEQHRGDAIGAPADQFSFCVSLYWALCGSFPFDGDSADAYADNVMSGKVSTPSPRVPRWLWQVIARGISVKPPDRFSSMEALLAAVRADPREARRRWLRGALGGLATIALVGAVVAGGLAWQARRAVLEQARLAQQFGQEVERISAIFRYSASLPLHDTRREMDAIRARMERLKERMQSLGPLAAGPGHEALGRGHLALEHYDEALAELEAARATGYRTPELAYALGLVHGKLYERALGDLHRTDDPAADTARRNELARTHRDPALRHLKEAGGHEGVDAPEYVEGLIALYEQRFDDALAHARKTEDRVLWQYEARTLEGDIHLVAGKELYFKGKVEPALEEYRRAGDAYHAATEVARSGVAAYAGDCKRILETSVIEIDRDQSPEPTVKLALAACDAALAARPDDAGPLVGEARVWQDFGNYQARHGGDASAAHEQAIRLARQALALDPKQALAYYVIGWAHLTMAETKIDKGEDPRRLLDRGIESALRMLEFDAHGSQGYALLCHLYDARGDYEDSRGDDPRRSYEAAMEYARKALKVEPGSFHAWNALGISRLGIGAWEASHGFDPREAFGRAVEAYDKVVQLSPNLDYGYNNVCEVHLDWADFELRRGIDPQPRLRQAIAACEKAIERDANFAGSHLNLGVAYLKIATWQLESVPAVDPMAMIERGRGSLQRSLGVDPQYGVALQGMAESRLLEGRWLGAHGRDPLVVFAAAEKLAQQQLALANGKSAEALRLLAEVSRRRAGWRTERKLDASVDVRAGLKYVARALAENPRLARAAAVQAALNVLGAQAATSDAARVASTAQARASLEQALAIDANLQRELEPLRTVALGLASHP